MIAVTIIVFAVILFLFIKKKYRLFGLLTIIYISILPVFSPVVIAWFIAERYLYVGSVAFLIMFVLLLNLIEKKTFENFALVAVVFLFIIFGVRTMVRTQDFKTNKGIWLATLKNAPLSYRVFNNLGDVYTKENNFPEAIKYFEQSVRLKPDYADAVYNIGYVYTLLPDYEKAKAWLAKSLEMNPRIFQSYYVLGLIAYKEGNVDYAIALINKTLELSPQYTLAQRAMQELITLRQQLIIAGMTAPDGTVVLSTTPNMLINDQTQPGPEGVTNEGAVTNEPLDQLNQPVQVQPVQDPGQPTPQPAQQQVLPILQNASVPAQQ